MLTLRWEVQRQASYKVQAGEVSILPPEMARFRRVPQYRVGKAVPIQLPQRHRRPHDILAERFPGFVGVNFRIALNREAGMLPGKQLPREIVVDELPPRRFAEIIGKQAENEPAQLGVQCPVVLEIHAQAFRDREYKLSVGQLKEQILAQVFAHKQGTFLTARGAEKETLARKRHKEIVRAVRTAHPGDALFPIAA